MSSQKSENIYKMVLIKKVRENNHHFLNKARKVMSEPFFGLVVWKGSLLNYTIKQNFVSLLK